LKDVFGQIYRDGGSIVHGMGSLGCGDRSTLTGFPFKGEESIPLRHQEAKSLIYSRLKCYIEVLL
jgi:hypothetical protein